MTVRHHWRPLLKLLAAGSFAAAAGGGFILYQPLRQWAGGPGFDAAQMSVALAGTLLAACLGSAVALGAVMTGVASPHIRAVWRHRRGRCIRCAYDLLGRQPRPLPQCPECGTVRARPHPPPWRFGWIASVMFLGACAGALLGSAVGECLWLLDRR